ncbi:hypothetical protein, partial [Salmonella enterica]|uniref:hypothetical protein n=1 Tax=Salmonella enterica TaxID=28901 RepID=UPI003FA7D511
SEVGQQPQRLPDQVIAVVRDEKVYRYFDPVVTQLARGDRLVVVRPARELPWAPPSRHPRRGARRGGLIHPQRGIEHLFEPVRPWRGGGRDEQDRE